VLVGPDTAKAEAVLWEIAETNRQEHAIFGVQIHRDKTHPIPLGLPSSRVVRWDFDAIVGELERWGPN
jgi:Thoeris protein ThsB, TIR-like domain